MGLAIAMAVQDKTTHQKTFGSNMRTTTLAGHQQQQQSYSDYATCHGSVKQDYTPCPTLHNIGLVWFFVHNV